MSRERSWTSSKTTAATSASGSPCACELRENTAAIVKHVRMQHFSLLQSGRQAGVMLPTVLARRNCHFIAKANDWQYIIDMPERSHLLHEAAQQHAGGHELDPRGTGGLGVQPHRVPDAPPHRLAQQRGTASRGGPGSHAPRLQHLHHSQTPLSFAP